VLDVINWRCDWLKHQCANKDVLKKVHLFTELSSVKGVNEKMTSTLPPRVRTTEIHYDAFILVRVPTHF